MLTGRRVVMVVAIVALQCAISSSVWSGVVRKHRPLTSEQVAGLFVATRAFELGGAKDAGPFYCSVSRYSGLTVQGVAPLLRRHGIILVGEDWMPKHDVYRNWPSPFGYYGLGEFKWLNKTWAHIDLEVSNGPGYEGWRNTGYGSLTMRWRGHRWIVDRARSVIGFGD